MLQMNGRPAVYPASRPPVFPVSARNAAHCSMSARRRSDHSRHLRWRYSRGCATAPGPVCDLPVSLVVETAPPVALARECPDCGSFLAAHERRCPHCRMSETRVSQSVSPPPSPVPIVRPGQTEKPQDRWRRMGRSEVAEDQRDTEARGIWWPWGCLLMPLAVLALPIAVVIAVAVFLVAIAFATTRR